VRRSAIAASLAGILALTLYLAAPLVRCPEACFVDYVALHGGETGNFEIPDARLNSWILGWVQHSLASGAPLFDTNAFHPARNTLAGSEHMLAIALTTLPVRAFSDSAIALHQTALVLSFAILGWAVFACVRWASGSTLAAFFAGACALFMPWRFSEVSHLQLLSAQWFPLIWLLTARLLLGQGETRHVVALAGVFALQLLSSFYLAYFALFSTGLLALAIAFSQRPRSRDIARIALALTPALLALLALSLPYVSRYTAYRWATPTIIPKSTPPGLVWEFLRPTFSLLADRERLTAVSYHIPLALFFLGLLPFAPARLRNRAAAPDADESRARALALGLAAAVAGAFVLMLGRQIHLFGADWPLPAMLLAKLLPGFSQMRAEFRWGIVIGVAWPILAGLGIAIVERRWLAASTHRGLRLLFAAGLAALFAINVPWFQLPAKAAWRSENGIFEVHRALTELPPGPVVEIPWRFRRLHLSNYGSRYLLASSAHWYPLLNGYTAYLPESHFFLQRIGQSLPSASALQRLTRLTGLRWIVVHHGKLLSWERLRWEKAEREGLVRRAFSSDTSWLFEVVSGPRSAEWIEHIASPAPRDITLAGLPRTPLRTAEMRGNLEVRAPERMVFQHEIGADTWVELEISNDSSQPWPGFDPQTEGLVLLRYRFRDERGALLREDVAAFDVDTPAGQRVHALAIVKPPAVAGRFEIEFDLVQRLGDSTVALAVPPVRRAVVIGPALSPSSRMRDDLLERSRNPTRSDLDRSDLDD
jgi:hypothetical protein